MKEEEVSTIVGSGVHLTGTLKDQSDIVVHGSVEGEVSSEQNVIVGDNAKVKGPVTAQTVSVSGEVKGTITAHDKLEIHPSGQVDGNIKTKDLIIHSGARFTGKSEMMTSGGSGETVLEEESPEIEKSAEEEDKTDIEIEDEK